jgi:hypothetical protein
MSRWAVFALGAREPFIRFDLSKQLPGVLSVGLFEAHLDIRHHHLRESHCYTKRRWRRIYPQRPIMCNGRLRLFVQPMMRHG